MIRSENFWTDEAIFNRQNDRVYAHSSEEATDIISKVERGNNPPSVMGWGGVSYECVTKLYFCEQRVKTQPINYLRDILKKVG
jgi:hypothetical protein